MKPDEPIDFLGTLCAIDSRTAEGARGTTQVSAMFAERLRPLGFDVEWVDPFLEEGARGRHLKAVRNPHAAVRLVFIGHTDTVLSPVEVPFRLDTRKGRAYGSGVCDMKGGCVLLLEAIRFALAESDPVRKAGLVVLFNCAEEFPGPSFPRLARDAARGASACLGFEPAPLGPNKEHLMVNARKGVVRFQLSCFGRAAHAGNDHAAGVNAIREVARKIEQIEALTDYDAGLTANVGCVSGGQASNQVADVASAAFEIRAFEGEVLNCGCDAVKKICEEPTVRAATDGVSTRLEVSECRSYPPWPLNVGTDALLDRYVRLAQEHGLTVKPVRRGGGSDASHVADLAPTLDGLGILGGGLHTPDEWADIETFSVRIRIAAELMADVCVNPVRVSA